MLVLGLDLETSGLDKDVCDVLEFGAALWNVEEKRPVYLFSKFNRDFKSEVPLEIENLIGLKAAEVRKWGKPLRECLDELSELMEAADYIVAHNGTGFDKPFLEHTYKSIGLKMPEKIWIDTQIDLPFPDGMGTRKLSYLSCEHGFINPFPHRAITDALSTLKLMAHYDFDTVVAVASTPLVQVIAQVSYDERHKPRQAGFRWDSQRKFWYLDIRQALIPSREFNFAYHINDND
ncbi:MAG: 3'-5' exonuclease [Bdellovibrionales bacterium]